MNGEAGAVENKLLAVDGVVGDQMTPAVNANEELVQRLVRMLAPDLFARNAEDEEVSLEVDGDVVQGFAEGENP